MLFQPAGITPEDITSVPAEYSSPNQVYVVLRNTGYEDLPAFKRW
jgi:hypothetical protein